VGEILSLEALLKGKQYTASFAYKLSGI